MAAWDRVQVNGDGSYLEYVLDNGMDRANVYWLEADGRVFFVAQEDPRNGGNRTWTEGMPEMDRATAANVRDRVRELFTRNRALQTAVTLATKATA